MAIKLNHTIVPAKDKDAAASFFAGIFGLSYNGPAGHFAPVRVNDELTWTSTTPNRSSRTTMRFTSVMMSSMRSSGACRKPAWLGAANRAALRTGK
jgi:hypothetical protein